MEFSLAKWSTDLTKWTYRIKIYELQLFFSIKQLTRIKTRKGNATFYKNVVDSTVFGKRSTRGVIKQLLKEANPMFLPLCRGWRIVITPLHIRLKIPRTEISPLALLHFV